MKANFFKNVDKGELITKLIISAILGLTVGFVLFYVFLPPLNLQSVGFWVYLFVVLLAFLFPFLGIKLDHFTVTVKTGVTRKTRSQSELNLNKKFLIPLLVPIAVIAVGLIISSEVFNARSYASIISIEESDFATDMPKTAITKPLNNIYKEEKQNAYLSAWRLRQNQHSRQ